MKVIKIKPRGYCKGVIRAINIVKEASKLEGPIYVLGMIVHNQYIVNAFKDIGIETIDHPGKTRLELLDEINKGTVIITAHGASEEVTLKAKNKGLNVIDATCLDVIKTHDLIKEKLSLDKHILYIGKAGHPEAEGAISINSKRIHLIQSKQDIDQLNPHLSYCITNQTTMSLYDVYALCEYAKEVLDNVTIEEETCNATSVRQKAIKNMDDEIDIAFIVGDPRSNNSKKLASIAKEKTEVYMIETVQDIDINVLKGKQCAGISSGASTPTYLTNQVIEYLEQFNEDDSSTYPKPELDLSKII